MAGSCDHSNECLGYSRESLDQLTSYKLVNNIMYNVNVVVLGCNAVWTCRHIPMFWRKILPPSLYETVSPYSITNQKSNISILTSATISNLYKALSYEMMGCMLLNDTVVNFGFQE
jgi:hypothetical protein